MGLRERWLSGLRHTPGKWKDLFSPRGPKDPEGPSLSECDRYVDSKMDPPGPKWTHFGRNSIRSQYQIWLGHLRGKKGPDGEQKLGRWHCTMEWSRTRCGPNEITKDSTTRSSKRNWKGSQNTDKFFAGRDWVARCDITTAQLPEKPLVRVFGQYRMGVKDGGKFSRNFPRSFILIPAIGSRGPRAIPRAQSRGHLFEL